MLVMMIAGTICLVVVTVTVGLIVEEFLRPEHDTSAPASQIGDIINTLIGLLAGFLAGKADKVVGTRDGNGRGSTGSEGS
jgi:hypothetical protein